MFRKHKCSDVIPKCSTSYACCNGRRGRPADLHDDVTYQGWGKSSAAGHRECMGNSKRVLRRSVSLLLGKTDRLHALIFATKRVGVFISESDGCIAVR